ncbi:alpha/beta fold hydrolase [Blastopirellula marina]|uniref:Alpha/beta hydrolase n=1 Tax=Blastopirellula marina TaxID=124 RepID=A0A2S8FLU0_9BACT|nr:alpha/beta fold hydrolase [Blastopirellula marina]PQO33133.1 alpha/beta hydrolase [Blastopirellula marina]PTL43300.1 alpha/beta hydrolase [Blastopirellula marina]
MDHTLTIGDTQFFVRTEGTGSPLLLVHGFPLDHHMWDAVIPALAADHLVIAPDLRGFGQSTGYVEIAPMEMFADDLAAMLTQLEIDQPVTYCGLSMGGYIGWQMVRRHPDRLARLVQLDTRAAADSEVQARARGVNAQHVLTNGMSDVPDAMLPKLLSERTRAQQPQVVATMREMILRQDPRAAAAAQRGMAQRPDVTSWLPEISLPTLAICGSEDSISPPDEMQAFAEQIPGAKFMAIATAAHMAPLENPPATSNAIQTFCQDAG